MARFTTSELKALGFFANENGLYAKAQEVRASKRKKPKPINADSGSKGKNFIEFALIAAKVDYVKEHLGIPGRKFRFDFAILSRKIAVEYNGIMSEKSRHTSISGYSKDMEKINAAQINGWKILQYTPLNYGDVVKDLQELLKK